MNRAEPTLPAPGLDPRQRGRPACHLRPRALAPPTRSHHSTSRSRSSRSPTPGNPRRVSRGVWEAGRTSYSGASPGAVRTPCTATTRVPWCSTGARRLRSRESYKSSCPCDSPGAVRIPCITLEHDLRWAAAAARTLGEAVHLVLVRCCPIPSRRKSPSVGNEWGGGRRLLRGPLRLHFAGPGASQPPEPPAPRSLPGGQRSPWTGGRRWAAIAGLGDRLLDSHAAR